MPNEEVHIGDDWYLDENNNGDLIFYNARKDEVVKAIDVITGAEDKKSKKLENIGQLGVPGFISGNEEEGYSLKNVSTLKADFIESPSAIGLRMNWTDDTWEYIDSEGNSLGWTPDFTKLSPWNQIRRVNMNESGEIVAAWGDDDYEHAPTDPAVNVMVEIPAFWFDYDRYTEGGKTYSDFYVANYDAAGMKPFPHMNQGSRPETYLGAYQAGFRENAGSFLMTSRSGVQPWTGRQVWNVAFTAGNNEPNIGDSLSTPTEAGWLVYDYKVSSGTWGGGDAVGRLYLRKPGDDTQGWADAETITNDTQTNTLGTSDTVTSQSSIHFDIEESRGYAQNLGSGWQQKLVWGYAAHRILSMFYLGSMDFQSEIGRGIVDKGGGTGFNGELTGADSIDAQLTEANLGTAVGTGSDGYTPVAVLWVENPWGNIREFVDGYLANDSEYRILRRDGEWSNPGPSAWISSDYEVSSATPLTNNDGYISDLESEELLALLGIPSAVVGSNSTYIPDYLYSHDSGEDNILLSGGRWVLGSRAGLGSLLSSYGVGYSNRNLGARLEFIG